MPAPLVVLESASLAYGHGALLDHANFQLDAGERVGLIGRNGCGKSSLLNVIAQTTALDDGRIWCAANLSLSLVAQEPVLDPKATVFEQVAHGLGDICRQILAYHHVSHALAIEEGNIDALLTQLQSLQAELEHGDGWRVNSRIETVLTRLRLSADALIGELSGGVKKRVALAQALVVEPDVLILDEPTNHLDLPTIEWLEELLQKFSGSVLFVTHDRRFLDNVATRIVELDRGKIANFPGNYSTYERKKAEMRAVESDHQEKFDKFLAQEEIWIRKGIEARRTRNEGRVRRLESLRRERALRRERIGRVNFHVDHRVRSGTLVAELDHVTKAFQDNFVIEDFSCHVMRGDKIGLIGPNGIGKSTFLKLILGEIAPDKGSIRLGSKLSIAYFDQFREQLDEQATVADVIVQGSQFIEINGQQKHVISYLADFLFPPERARAKVSALSGGERNRLLLARLFTRPANVLVLDEPTNDLDIETLELLESLIQEYTGTVFVVSHDRAFLDNIVTQVIVFEGNGKLVEYAGGYRDWRDASVPNVVKRQKVRVSEDAAEPSKLPRLPKLTFKEARELESVAHTIAALERDQAEITRMLSDPSLYQGRPDEVRNLHDRFSANEKQLNEKMARWEELETKKVV